VGSHFLADLTKSVQLFFLVCWIWRNSGGLGVSIGKKQLFLAYFGFSQQIKITSRLKVFFCKTFSRKNNISPGPLLIQGRISTKKTHKKSTPEGEKMAQKTSGGFWPIFISDLADFKKFIWQRCL
jgi:hypothetical protein